MNPGASKVTADHLKRDAYLYVRQSTLRQVLEHTESTKRQYGLRQRAVALGWPADRVVVIDQDQGRSAAGAADRAGFQRLVGEVGMGHAGIVLGLEVSRLARSSTDWHRLLEICALTGTLILDEDGIYDPAHFNDRLLLGLKGTMSEAELHVLRARLRGGIQSKARRGELKMPLPTGLVYDEADRVVRDPDRQVQAAVGLFFQTFRRTGSASATVGHFRAEGLLFPTRLRSGPHKGEVVFAPLEHSRALRILQNPRYAGGFAFGRTRTRPHPGGGCRQKRVPREEWQVLIPEAHPGYITWAEYEENLRRLRENAQAYGAERRRSPPREGPALLQGLLLCGRCGLRMTVRYNYPGGVPSPMYVCQRTRIQRGEPLCQSVPGTGVDEAVGRLLVEAVTPLSLEVALEVGEELSARAEEVDRLRRQHVERARYEAELAERRYRRVDPDHRLVADALEAEWNEKLRALAEAQQAYERERQADAGLIDEERRADILSLATDFPRLWQDPRTPARQRKQMARLLIEDVTLIKDARITAHVRFRGGATRTLTLPLPRSAAELRKTDPGVVRRIDELLGEHSEGHVAEILNAEGLRTGVGLPFNRHRVGRVRRSYGLQTRYQRLRTRGLLTLDEMARELDVEPQTVKVWRAAGLLKAYPYNARNECLYEPPGPDRPRKHTWKGLSGRRQEETSVPSASRGAV
ncbi:MAG: recombinase family protein [Candidatus Palauibacterales bacterium]|nr:recombinase family protein [Candidatus Palauibacterales bacterium]